jgi:carbamoyl-phosphate synthase large subunit
MGYETIIVNSNPETVSTDFDIADKLYFEPLTKEDLQNIIALEKPDGAIVQFGGQTAIKLAKHISNMGVKILGTSERNMDRAEDRKEFNEALRKCRIPQPAGSTIFTTDEAIEVANRLGYPVLVRPSYVLGGQGMAIAYDDESITKYVNQINKVKQKHAILVDKYIMGRECEVDAICDGHDILIPGIMEHLERSGVHSGDSISVYPSQTIYKEHIETICQYTKRIALELNVIGVLNIQFIISSDRVFIIEVNPRSSRTVPYISKVTNLPVIDIATNVIFGKKLSTMSYGTGLYKESKYIAVKLPVFSFEKIKGSETSLGPEMKSTGEVLGVDKSFPAALLKAFIAGGINIPQSGSLLVTVREKDYQELLPIIKHYQDLNFKIYATPGTGRFLSSHGIRLTTVEKI